MENVQSQQKTLHTNLSSIWTYLSKQVHKVTHKRSRSDNNSISLFLSLLQSWLGFEKNFRWRQGEVRRCKLCGGGRLCTFNRRQSQILSSRWPACVRTSGRIAQCSPYQDVPALTWNTNQKAICQKKYQCCSRFTYSLYRLHRLKRLTFLMGLKWDNSGIKEINQTCMFTRSTL